MAVAVALAAAWAAPAPAQAAPRVTVFGDSVQASFGFAPQAVRYLGRGLRLRMEADVCRRLASPGCLGGSPPSALEVARSLGSGLGEAVVINVGYNDDARVYDVPAMLATLRAAGVRAVVWVTLRERRPYYRPINDRIRAAARGGGPGGMVVRVADWNAYSAGRPWFASDGLHLNATGALGLATLLRERVLATMAEAGVSLPGRPAATVVPLRAPVARIAGDAGVLWVQARSGRLTSFEGDRGRRLPGRGAVAPGEALVSDGRGAWLRDASGTLTRPASGADGFRGEVVAGAGASPARAGDVLWSVAPCATGPACPEGQVLRATGGDGAARDVALPPGRVRAAAADRGALWLLAARGGGAVIERRDPVSGALVRRTRLPARAASGALAAGRGVAWVLPRDGRLLRVTPTGRARMVRAGVRAIAATGTELWAVAAGGRAVVRLDPRGRLRARASSPVRLSGRMALTRGNVWVLARSGRQAVRVPRPGA
ncbi:MAG TPA: hypothetical protein VFG74_13640 [Miltoncostaeaceae bacterium]|nr:hypothetical protein [Miltoncostaeaceae bacterium]